MAPEDRGCLFVEEGGLVHYSKYSYASCKFECLTDTAGEAVGCVPWYIPHGGETKVCQPWEALNFTETLAGLSAGDCKRCNQTIPSRSSHIESCSKNSFPTQQSFQELSPRLLHSDLLIHTELGTISPVRLEEPEPLTLVRPGQPDKATGLGKGGEGGVQQRQVGRIAKHDTWFMF